MAPSPPHATSWRRGVLLGLVVLGEMGTAIAHVASSTRCCRRAVAVSTNSLLEDRVRAQHLIHGCAPTRMSEATTSAALPTIRELSKRETVRFPCESHDSLFEDVAEASNQPHSKVDRSEKSDCPARFARFTRRAGSSSMWKIKSIKCMRRT